MAFFRFEMDFCLVHSYATFFSESIGFKNEIKDYFYINYIHSIIWHLRVVKNCELNFETQSKIIGESLLISNIFAKSHLSSCWQTFDSTIASLGVWEQCYTKIPLLPLAKGKQCATVILSHDFLYIKVTWPGFSPISNGFCKEFCKKLWKK